MTPDPGMSPEDRAIFDQLSSAMEAERGAALAGPPPAEQLAALRLAVGQRSWFWVRLRAHLGGLPSIIGMAALVAAVAAGVLVAANSNHHGSPASTSGTQPPGPGPTTSPRGPNPPTPPPAAGGTTPSPPNSSSAASAGAAGQTPATGGPSGAALATGTPAPAAATTGSPSGGSGSNPAPPPGPPRPPTPPPPPPPPVVHPSQVATTLHAADGGVIPVDGTVPLGTSVFDAATVSGVPGIVPTGTVTYTFFANEACRAPPVSTKSVAASTQSPPTGPLAAGSHSFEAAYSGDTNYKGSTSPCEPFTVTQAATKTATTLHAADGSVIPVDGAVQLGTSVFDAATVSGVPSIVPTGTVTYTFFNNGQCTGMGNPAGGGDLVGGVPPNSSKVGPPAAGTYAFQVVYSGDANYTGSTSLCEPFTVFTVVEPTAQITQGDVTCQQFTSGTSTSLTAGRYSVMGTTINGVNPGVFLYFSRVVAPAANFTASIQETNDSGSNPPYRNVPIDRSQLIVYSSTCQVVSSGVTPTFSSSSPGDVDLAFNGATAGATYIVSVKYSLTSLKDEPVPPIDPLTYTFSTDVGGSLVAGSRQTLLFERRAT